jgi:hypothetical protein
LSWPEFGPAMLLTVEAAGVVIAESLFDFGTGGVGEKHELFEKAERHSLTKLRRALRRRDPALFLLVGEVMKAATKSCGGQGPPIEGGDQEIDSATFTAREALPPRLDHLGDAGINRARRWISSCGNEDVAELTEDLTAAVGKALDLHSLSPLFHQQRDQFTDRTDFLEAIDRLNCLFGLRLTQLVSGIS